MEVVANALNSKKRANSHLLCWVEPEKRRFRNHQPGFSGLASGLTFAALKGFSSLIRVYDSFLIQPLLLCRCSASQIYHAQTVRDDSI
jgi:hypothetical protein